MAQLVPQATQQAQPCKTSHLLMMAKVVVQLMMAAVTMEEQPRPVGQH
jgi:hypothetical protein